MNIELNKLCIVRTLDLLKSTMKDNDFCFDIYFRMCVIDEYLKGNCYIWDLYDKMPLDEDIQKMWVFNSKNKINKEVKNILGEVK